LKAGESLQVETGCIVAFDEGVSCWPPYRTGGDEHKALDALTGIFGSDD